MNSQPNGKLLLLTHEFPPFRGGVAIYCAELAAALEHNGAAVTVLRGTSLRFWPLLRFAWRIWRCPTVRTESVLMGSVGAHLVMMLLTASGLLRPRRLLSLLHGSEVLRFQRNKLWRLLAPRFYRRVATVLTVSEFSQRLIERSFLGPVLPPIVIAPCACSTAATRPVASQHPNDSKLRILTLARLHPRKGQLDTARALARLPASSRASLIYQIAGKGDAAYQRQVEQTCRDAGVALELLGEIGTESLAETYAQCDIFAITSRTLPDSVEGFGIAYLEAGAHAKPVVAYRSGGAGEAVVHEETGLLAPEGDLDALAAAIQRLLGDVTLRERLGEAGRRRAAQFCWDTTARIVLQTIR